MPKNKKKWIDKKHSTTFRVVHRSQKDPLIVDENVGEHVLQPVQKKNMEEHIKYGIYFDDDYNYLQHLKSLDEVTEHEKIERTIIRAPTGKANLPSTLFETNGYELNIGLLNQAATSGAEVDIDPEISAALEGNFDFENPENALDDDFVINANDGELPSSQPPVPLPLPAARKSEFRTKIEAASDDDSSEKDSYSDDEPLVSDEDEAPKYIENSQKPRLIDEQFEKFCDEYTDASDEEMDEEEEGCLLDPNSDRMKMLAEEFKNRKPELVLENDEIARRYAEMDDETVEANEQLEKIAIDYPDRKKPKWDCESIVSTYSNIYNRPALIIDSSRKRKLKPILREIDKMDESETTASKRSVTTVRTRGETTEERKVRKAAVKAARAERRMEKKCNKLAFKEERKKLSARRAEPMIKAVPIV